jgi:hypothetical protein
MLPHINDKSEILRRYLYIFSLILHDANRMNKQYRLLSITIDQHRFSTTNVAVILSTEAIVMLLKMSHKCA